MKRNRGGKEEEEPCEICGDKGSLDRMMTCSQCRACEHNYCIEVPLSKIPEIWICEACQAKEDVKHDSNGDANSSESTSISEMNQRYGLRPMGPNRNLSNLRRQVALSKIKSVRTGKVKFPPIQEAMQRENEGERPSFPSIPRVRPCSERPSMSFQSPSTASTMRGSTILRSPVKVHEDPCLSSSGPARPSRDGSGSKSHQCQPTQVIEICGGNIHVGQHHEKENNKAVNGEVASTLQIGSSQKRESPAFFQRHSPPINTAEVTVSDETVLAKRTRRHFTEVLPVEANSSSVNTGASSSLIKEKSMDRVRPVRVLSGYLHRSRYSPSRCCSAFPKSGANSDAAVRLADSLFEYVRNRLPFSSSLVSWTGRFEFSGNAILSEYYGAFKAYPSARAHRRVHELSRLIPNDLPVELIPECQLLSNLNIFGRSPDLGDVALFFYPDGETDRSSKDYVLLLELARNEEYTIRGFIREDIELLIFTSKHLPLDKESGLKDDLFLWGVFRHAKDVLAPLDLPEEICRSGGSALGNPDNGLDAGNNDYEPAEPNSCKERDKMATFNVQKPVTWSPSISGWFKLNTSAVLREDKRVAGVGGSVHGPSGKWILGYVLNLGHCTQLRADLWALLHGLKLVAHRCYEKVKVETDSKLALECLRTEPDACDPNLDLIRACRKLLVKDWQISRGHVTLERNQRAIVLANLFEDHEVGVVKLLYEPPPELVELCRNGQGEQLPEQES